MLPEDADRGRQIGVYQGERPIAKKNHILGEFSMPLPPLPKGVPKIELTCARADG